MLALTGINQKQQEKQKKTEKVAAELRRKQRKAEKAAVAEGKKPYYPKKGRRFVLICLLLHVSMKNRMDTHCFKQLANIDARELLDSHTYTTYFNFRWTADLKTMERVARFKQIAAQGEGKVKDYITKRRKKNAAKDHRYVPYERR